LLRAEAAEAGLPGIVVGVVVAEPGPESSSASFERFEFLENKGILYGDAQSGRSVVETAAKGSAAQLLLLLAGFRTWPGAREHGAWSDAARAAAARA
jgi:hypothetical protein